MSTDENKFQRVQWEGDQYQPSDDDDADGLPVQPPRGSGIPEADLKLLELAARAIGAVRVDVVEGEEWVSLHFADGRVDWNWNPLVYKDNTHDLATDVRMAITHTDDEVCIAHSSIPTLREPVGEDRRAAVCRAVTRAAAEIAVAQAKKQA